MKSKIKNYFPEPTVACIVFFMVWLAGAVNDREVIFPEIAAIATGALLAPKYTWNVSKKRIFLLLLLCGTLGMGSVYFLPLGLTGQLMIAAVISQVIYLYSRTTFAPLVSAIVLPVLLQTKSVWYLISLILFTGIILGASCVIEKYEIRPKNTYVKVELPRKEDFTAAIIRCSIMCIMIAVAIRMDVRFAVAPPLLVAFTEFCKPGTHIKEKWVRYLVLLTGCAAIGAAVRYCVTVMGGYPLYVSALIAICAFLLVLRVSNIYLPPAGAMVLLAMLIPEDAIVVYPLQILLGAGVYIIVSVIYAKIRSMLTLVSPSEQAVTNI